MPRKEGQKRKLLVLLQILARETDERHPLSVPQIVEKLKEKGIEAERKSVYDDLGESAMQGVWKTVDAMQSGALGDLWKELSDCD